MALTKVKTSVTDIPNISAAIAADTTPGGIRDYVDTTTGDGTVTSVSVVTANGVSGSVATATTTPAITLALGAITPSSVASTGTVTGTNLSGTNTGDQTITLTSDVTGSGVGSFAATLATVNANVGSFGTATQTGTFTVNGKGLITAASNTTIQIAESQVTNLVTDLAGKAASGANTDITSVLLNQTGLVVKGATAVGLTIKPNETLTIARTLNLITGDADRSLTLTADASIGGTNTGDQTITLTGGVTGSGTGSFATTVITNANLTGHVTSVGNATVLGSFTVAQLNTAISDADVATGGGTATGTNTGDQTATTVSNTPAGNIAATTVQAAINELDTEKLALAGGTMTGTVTMNGAPAICDIATLADGATITPDFALANNFTVTLAGNRTLANPSNLVEGQSGVIYILQDGAGSRTLAYDSYWKFAGGTAPVLTTAINALDVLAYEVRNSTFIVASLMKDVK